MMCSNADEMDHSMSSRKLFAKDLFEKIPIIEDVSRILSVEDVGIYFLLQEEEIVYIGESINAFARIAHHERRRLFSGIDTAMFCQYLGDCKDRKEVEKALIKFVGPRFNGFKYEDMNERDMQALDRFYAWCEDENLRKEERLYLERRSWTKSCFEKKNCYKLSNK